MRAAPAVNEAHHPADGQRSATTATARASSSTVPSAPPNRRGTKCRANPAETRCLTTCSLSLRWCSASAA